MCVLFCCEYSHDIVIFVQRLAIVTSLDGIPPVGVRVAELTFDGECGGCVGVGVGAILVLLVLV